MVYRLLFIRRLQKENLSLSFIRGALRSVSEDAIRSVALGEEKLDISLDDATWIGQAIAFVYGPPHHTIQV